MNNQNFLAFMAATGLILLLVTIVALCVTLSLHVLRSFNYETIHESRPAHFDIRTSKEGPDGSGYTWNIRIPDEVPPARWIPIGNEQVHTL